MLNMIEMNRQRRALVECLACTWRDRVRIRSEIKKKILKRVLRSRRMRILDKKREFSGGTLVTLKICSMQAKLSLKMLPSR